MISSELGQTVIVVQYTEFSALNSFALSWIESRDENLML